MSPHATNGTRAKLGCEWKMQTRVDQRGGLARTGRADDHVPRQLIQITPLITAQTGLFQQGKRFVHALPQGRQFLGGGDAGRVRRGLGGQALHDGCRLATDLNDAKHPVTDPDREQ